MSLDKYKQWQHRFANTKPIRGRAVECRPFGARREDWKEIVKVLTPLGEGYGARLYQTDCVVIAPNGDMFIKTGGWATPITAEWIQLRSGLRCYKKYNEVWLEIGDGRSIPLDKDKPTHIKWDEETRKYTCDKVIKMEQKVVDKGKIKSVRHSVKEFKTFVKVMMKLSDGWVGNELVKMHRVRDQSSVWSRYNYELMGEKFDQYQVRGDRMYSDTAKRLIKCMQEVQTDDDKVKLMLILTEGVGCEESRVISTIQEEYDYQGTKYPRTTEVRDYRYNPDSVVRRIDYIIKKGSDVFTTKEVEVTKPMTNLL